MRIHKLFGAMALAASFALAPAAGCYGTTEVTAYDEPPPPREEVVVTRPGFIWVHGHWLRDGGRWRWHGGYYEHERPGYTYLEGHWERRGPSHVWIEGGWREANGVVVR